ncbi:phosphoglucosamine mutase [Methanococcoides methylutens]|uniref:Probable phosphoglucosamine mutase n=1 Tax=Methanococcoides methylutens MM1 TaxID=1434104 RepID=A0A0E3SQT9_METMT|nr:phosphoglucosamine mutase [Methanococcoides methylutens]AKB84538.1 Phosphomannomutase [Methanococcoides methylutens MM1]
MKLFGSSGIRGITNKDVTVELALKVGLALGKTKRTAVIGRDPRIAGEMIEHAVISGLLSSGCDVVRVGMVSTPTLAYASRNYDCGVMITASHNPSEYVGIKLWNPDGMAFDSTQQEEIEEIIENEAFEPVRWDEIGNLTEDSNAIRQHVEMIVKSVERSSKRIVIDCGSGAGSTITPYVLREIGCEVITLNSQPDGYFPARNPEPNDSNLTLLKKAVKEFEADIGIAQDGDADRMMTVDENGEFITGDEMLAMFARHECKSDAKLVVPVDTSMMVDDALPDSTVVRTRVGDVYVAEEIKRSEADFGGEPSGSWIFPEISYCPDGIYASAKVMELVQDKTLSELKNELPHYPTRRGTVKCENDKKKAVMELVSSELATSGDVTDIDGIRVDLKEGWVLVRPSGTEPKIRITAEAREGVDKLYEMVENVVKRGVA